MRSSERLCRCCWRRCLLLRSFSTCLLPLAAIVSASGCGGIRASLHDSGDAIVRAGPELRGRVYVWTGEQWELSSNRVTIPEGWYIGPVEPTE